MHLPRRLMALALGVALPALMSCGDDSSGPTADDVRDFFASFSTASGAVDATFHSGSPPTDGSGPTALVTGTAAMILGGSTLRTITSTQAFNRIILSVEDYPGYWELQLPSSVTTQDVILTLAQSVANEDFTVRYNAASGASVGAADDETVSIVSVGTGDVQVSVSWNTQTDVDLHLVEPGGEEIYYGNDVSESGGTLDLDSNAACSNDGIRNENITWPTGSPPRGTYIVRVDYWSACGLPGPTNYVVTVRVRGREPQTFTGSFTGAGDQGGAGSGTQVTTFVF